MRHTLVTLVEDKPGVLTRVAGLFRRRNFNIESLTVGHSETPEISRMTIVVNCDDAVLEQVIKQLYKLVNVTKITDVTDEQTVIRELALIKVQANASTRAEIIQFAEVFEAKIVDLTRESVTIEITGTEDKVAYARQFYNDTVNEYNTKIETVPWSAIARTFKFTEREYFAAGGEARGPVDVDF